MADISLTASQILSSGGGQTGTAGASITQGQVLYMDSSTNTLKLADADGATAATAAVAGIALNAASSGQPVTYVAVDSALTLGAGASLLAGDTIYLSDTPGGMTKTVSDLEAGDYRVVLGVMTSTTVLNLKIVQGGLIA